MLRREFKLKNSIEIKNVLKLGRKFRQESLTLFVVASPLNCSRAAVVVSGKIVNTAVARNRVRRLIFTDLERRLNAWENRGASDMVVMVMNIPSDEKRLLTDLDQCFANW